MKDKTMCGQAPADQPTDDKMFVKKLNEQITKRVQALAAQPTADM